MRGHGKSKRRAGSWTIVFQVTGAKTPALFGQSIADTPLRGLYTLLRLSYQSLLLNLFMGHTKALLDNLLPVLALPTALKKPILCLLSSLS